MHPKIVSSAVAAAAVAAVAAAVAAADDGHRSGGAARAVVFVACVRRGLTSTSKTNERKRARARARAGSPARPGDRPPAADERGRRRYSTLHVPVVCTLAIVDARARAALKSQRARGSRSSAMLMNGGAPFCRIVLRACAIIAEA